MWYKQQIELAILPRIFKGIKVGYKGQYSIRFQLVHQSEQGTRTSAYPYIYHNQKCNIQGQKNIQVKRIRKNAKTQLQNNRGFFQTNQYLSIQNSFHIEFESHIEYLNQMCIFKLEYKMKKSKGRTFLLVELVSHRSIINQNKQNNKLELKKVTKVVDSQKININRFNQDLSEFLQVEFLDNDYFSTIWMYIGSVHLGWKIRNSKMSLCQFLCEDPKQKKRIIQFPKKYILTQDLAGRCLRQLTRQYVSSSQQFYKITIKKSLTQGQRIFEAWKEINNRSQYPQSLNNLSQQFQFILNLNEYNFNQQNISQYYQASDLNSLYFSIHYENQMIVVNVRALWQNLLDKIKSLSVHQFQCLCQESIKENERDWIKNCTRFVYNNNNFENDRFSKQILSNIEHQRSSILKNSKHSSSSINIQESLGKRRLKGSYESKMLSYRSTMESSVEALQIRSQQVEKFKIWRTQHVSNEKIYSDTDLSHPLLIFQNYSEHTHKVHKKGLTMSLVVFIHGFKGSQIDLEKASQYLLKYSQNVDILRINTLQPDIDYQIEQMASIVANQVKKYISLSINKFQSISIVGYSLGGIIGRASLRYLDTYRSKMNIFVTFSSPHLGTFLSDNKFVKLGIWYLTKVNKNTMLQQLHTCRDLETSSKSYMKQLSQRNHISWFKKIILVSCQEDQFVPHMSSRIDINFSKQFSNIRNTQDNNQYNKFQSQIKQMSENILRHAKKLERVEVWFDNQKKKSALDKITGRQSHIQFLDNNSFLKWFFKIYGKQF